MEIIKEMLEKDPSLEGAYKLKFSFKGKGIDVRLDPDDVTVEEVLLMVNRVLAKFELYEERAKDSIVNEFLDDYNKNWVDTAKGYLALTEHEFRSNLELHGINFLSKDCIEVFYSENGMFGNHSLVAQSFDGENFDDAVMFG